MNVRGAQLQHKAKLAESICHRCCHTPASVIPCSSLDCLVLFERTRLARASALFYESQYVEFMALMEAHARGDVLD
jgi:hypothetical protein